jgi:hypothetical protein
VGENTPTALDKGERLLLGGSRLGCVVNFEDDGRAPFSRCVTGEDHTPNDL